MKRIPYKDLYHKTEDERIQEIGEKVFKEKLIVGFVVDDEPDKPERYVRKLRAAFPGIRIISQKNGPVTGTVLVQVGPPVN